jgi:hypothetical protein
MITAHIEIPYITTTSDKTEEPEVIHSNVDSEEK